MQHVLTIPKIAVLLLFLLYPTKSSVTENSHHLNDANETSNNSSTTFDLTYNDHGNILDVNNGSTKWKKLDDFARIVNGDDVNLGHLPFMVRLIMNRNGGLYVCGGSLLSEHWVLTAAHCVTEDMQIDGSNYTFVMDGYRIMVKAGDVAVDVYEHSQENRIVTQVYLHPNYHPWYLKADIALLYIEDGFLFTQYDHDNIDIVQLGSVLPDAGTPVTVAGWGKTEDGELANTLQMHSYLVPNQEACRIHYANLGYYLAPGMWCTGDYDMTSHSAHGDSGGPVFINTAGTFTQYGLVSWGLDLEELGSHDFDVNADVPFYKTWIEETLETYEESRQELTATDVSHTATIKMSGLNYFLVNITCETGLYIKVDFTQLSLSWDMSHLIVRDGPDIYSKLILQTRKQTDIENLGVTSSSDTLLIIIRSSMSQFTKTVKFTFEAVSQRGENIRPCEDSMTLCGNGLLCYSKQYKCDENQTSDCPDGSDEENCDGRENGDGQENGLNRGKSNFGILLIIVLLVI